MAVSQFDYKVVVSGIETNTGNYWEMAFGYLISGVIAGKNAFEIAGELITAFAANTIPALLDTLPINVRVADIWAKKLGGGGGPPAILAVDDVGVLSICETIGNGPQVTWYGDVDPILQGRTYLPGIPNDSLDNGVWDAAYIASNQAWRTAMLVQLIVFTEVADFCVQSAQIGINSQVVNIGLLRSVPGTQRRRLRR